MVCDTLVYHPTVTKLIKFLETTQGREKILRLLQYLSRFLAVQQSSIYYRQLQAQFTLIRKVLRFLKPLNHLQAASKFYDDTISQDYLVRLCNIIKNLGYASYLSFDQINLLRMLRIVPSTNFTTVKVPRYCNWFWFIALISGLTLDIRKIQISELKLNQKISKDSIDKEKDSMKHILLEKHSATRRLVWDSLDTFIVANNLGFFSNREDYVALAGVVTSLLGLQDLWKGTK
ncbi:hypothetical protein KAFR_0A08680 [Kazachstania africana CBS 2517]|uniref:Peroxisomal biogenesis factor 11 n=1 Tax=Kazachstania africana (strain ATCC 22294 / BCRC 22015 / CBS 2517 / CECT 1963 / NBRC 1671 / NRRL Y-8276) TaxID=1071382 RepID=H2APK2_KAZAF|nr:hypothetical protein KAFR_0A08680 [Kazachstania africana CBS 2517]CCF56302.1 hypothetical protein KAFR_0A08680 [Kazachstania africana CBS 2517]